MHLVPAKAFLFVLHFCVLQCWHRTAAGQGKGSGFVPAVIHTISSFEETALILRYLTDKKGLMIWLVTTTHPPDAP